MLDALDAWSAANLGQWHYILGYLIVVSTHNWLLVFGGGTALWSAVRAFSQPSRSHLCWLYASLGLVFCYEYDKHVADKLHAAVNFLLIGELAILNGAGHMLVGAVTKTLCFVVSLLFVLYGLWLSSRRNDNVPKH